MIRRVVGAYDDREASGRANSRQSRGEVRSCGHIRPVRILGLFIGLIAVSAGNGLHAADGPSDKSLAKHGLTRAGSLFVLESEAAVHTKADEVRHLSRQLGSAVAQQRATLSEKQYQDTIKELTAELNQLSHPDERRHSEDEPAPQGQDRRGYPANNIVAEEYQELNYYKNQLQMEISQRTAFLNQLKSKPFDPKARIKADAEVRNREEALHQGVLDLRKLVDDVHEKYTVLAKDPQVKKWLDTPEGHAGVKPRLGPSRAFLLDEKMLQRLEAQSAADEPGAATPTKAVRKGRRSRTSGP